MAEPEKKPRTYVLDTSAILAGRLEAGLGKYLTSRGVVDEVRFGNLALERLEAAIEQGSLSVAVPRPETLDKVMAAARETGDLSFLSTTDLELLAIALQESSEGRDVTLITDDYGIQNTAKALNIKFSGAAHPVIRRAVRWSFVCDSCKTSLPQPADKCPYCGNVVRKKPVKKQS